MNIGKYMFAQVAIIAYLIVAKIKADYKSPYSITEVATLIRISALERVDLRTSSLSQRTQSFKNKMSKNSLYLMNFNNRAILSHQY